MLKNPFLVYVIAFGGVLLVYPLGWSDIYPSLSAGLLAFLAITFCVSAILAIPVGHIVKKIETYEPGRLPKWTIFLLLAGFSADLIYTGIPLLSVLRGARFNGQIGVPSLHVFNVTFGASFSAIRFADFLYSKRRQYLLEAAVPMVFFALVFYRGPVIMCLVAWFFVYAIKIGRLGVKRIVLFAVISAVVLYIFGLAGNLRVGEFEIENVGRPTQEFQHSSIPKIYFWAFIYATSPMANLQLTTANHFEKRGVAEFFLSELVPDFISKRILPFVNKSSATYERVHPAQIAPALNVATLYGRSFVLAGWAGMVKMYAALALLIIVYLHLVIRSPYAVPCLALLNMLVVFCTFQNMIAFSGVILQLVWPLLLSIKTGRTSV